MPICKTCADDFAKDEGDYNDDQDFFCFDCQTDSPDVMDDQSSCPECGEDWELIDNEGACRNCGCPRASA